MARWSGPTAATTGSPPVQHATSDVVPLGSRVHPAGGEGTALITWTSETQERSGARGERSRRSER